MKFEYRNGQLHCSELNLLELSRKQNHPFYFYDFDQLRLRIKNFRDAFDFPIHIHYAMKANAHLPLLKLMQSLGLGVDIVSGGELSRALEAGFDPKNIVFSGVAKSEMEIKRAIELDLEQINVESLPELERIGKITDKLNKNVKVAIRINPDVTVDTHPYIQTGFRENKFGLDPVAWPKIEVILKTYPKIKLVGLTMHIGSQITDIKPLEEAVQKTRGMFLELKGKGYPLETLDVGGGWGIHYEKPETAEELSNLKKYGEMITRETKTLSDQGVKILCEPGRSLVARMGILIAQVEYVKVTRFKKFLILNTGMHHLIRPALYQAHHRFLPLVDEPDRPREFYDVVGPICESSDVLAKNRDFQQMREGEFLAICDAGAYGFSMASQYNLHPLPKEYVYDQGKLISF
jgi:diaminopimelate decarboxylase